MLRPQRERKLVSIVHRAAAREDAVAKRARSQSQRRQSAESRAVQVARHRPRVLLLDEPTRGIDINAKREIYALIDELARDGLGVVMVRRSCRKFWQLPTASLCWPKGRVTAEFARDEATEEKLLTAALPTGKRQKGQIRMKQLESQRAPCEVSVAAGARAVDRGDEPCLRSLSHGRQRPECAAADFDQSVPVDRHDDDHPFRRHRSCRSARCSRFPARSRRDC